MSLAVAGVLFGLALCELIVRLAGPSLLANFTTRALQERHPLYGIFHRPGASAWVRDPEFTTYVRFNRDGLRGPDLTPVPTSARTRILVVGDSFVEGAEVDETDALPPALARQLTLLGHPVEALNAGVRGWGTAQEYLYLINQGLLLQPDVVILVVYVGNDLADNSPELSQSAPGGAQRRPFFALDERGLALIPPDMPPPPPLAPVLETARVHSAFFNLVESGVEAKLAYADQAEVLRSTHRLVFATPPSPAWERSWAVTEALLMAARDATEARGARFLLAVAPHKAQLDTDDWERLARGRPVEGMSWDRYLPQQRLADLAAKHRIPKLDLLPALDAARAADSPYFAQNSHWTVAGHQAVAEAIARELLSSGAVR